MTVDQWRKGDLAIHYIPGNAPTVVVLGTYTGPRHAVAFVRTSGQPIKVKMANMYAVSDDDGPLCVRHLRTLIVRSD